MRLQLQFMEAELQMVSSSSIPTMECPTMLKKLIFLKIILRISIFLRVILKIVILTKEPRIQFIKIPKRFLEMISEKLFIGILSFKPMKTGKAKVEFYNSDANTTFRMIIEGAAYNGLLGRTNRLSRWQPLSRQQVTPGTVCTFFPSNRCAAWKAWIFFCASIMAAFSSMALISYM